MTAAYIAEDILLTTEDVEMKVVRERRTLIDYDFIILLETSKAI